MTTCPTICTPAKRQSILEVLQKVAIRHKLALLEILVH